MFSYYDKAVCKVAFLIIHDLGKKELNNLLKHLKMNGPALVYHNNKGRNLKYALLFYNIFEISDFPFQQCPHGKASVETPVPLPASLTKTDIHTWFQSVCEESIENCIFLKKTLKIKFCVRGLSIPINTTTKYEIWKVRGTLQCVPHFQIASPRSDVCPKCEFLRCYMIDAVSEEEKMNWT